MESDDEKDPYASLIELCSPTSSQESKLRGCPFARESEDDQFSSSPDPIGSDPDGIVMVSAPDSGNSVQQLADDDAVFHTPPEHHLHSNLSSSEDQNVDEGGRGVDLVVGGEKVRVCESGGDDDYEEEDGKAESGMVRALDVGEEGMDGETVPVEDTEVVLIEENEEKVEVIDLDREGSGEEMNMVKLEEIVGAESVEVCRIGVDKRVEGELVLRQADADDDREEGCVSIEDGVLNKGEKHCVNRSSEESLDGGESVGCPENGVHCVGHSERVARVGVDEKMSKDGHGDLGTGGSAFERIDEFRYVARDDVEGRGKRRKLPGSVKEKEKDVEGGGDLGEKKSGDGHGDLGTGGSAFERIDEFRYVAGDDVEGRGRRRKLPGSVKEKEKNVEGGGDLGEKKSGLLEFLDVLKVAVGYMNEGCGNADGDEDILEIVKRRGMTFPRPSWWPPEGDDNE